MTTTLLFDMDGTLLDSSRAVIDAVAEGLRRAYAVHGLPVAEPDRGLIESSMGLPSPDYFLSATPPDTVPEDLLPEFADTFTAESAVCEAAAIARGETALYEGVEAALSCLKSRGHELMLFSNAGTHYFRAVIGGHGLERFFTRSLCIEEARASGAAPDKTGMVRHLVERPESAVVVGDRAHDVEAGLAAGARTVGCLYGFGTPEELRAADWRIGDPRELLDLPL